MNTRVAIIAIVVEDLNQVEQINGLLHDNVEMIIGRMGLPHRQKNMSLISIAVDGPEEAINALSGKLGALPGVAAKAVYSKIPS